MLISKKLLTISAIVFAATTMAATPASAASYEYNTATAISGSPNYDACSNTSITFACFQANGDQLWVYDGKADGKSAVLVWENGARKGACRNSSGSGKWAHCNKDFTEGSRIYFRGCVYDGDSGGWGASNPQTFLNNLENCAGEKDWAS
jgi:hypothetical protein